MTRPLISSVRCEVLGNHCHVSIWNRGGCAGKLVVDADDGVKLALLLIPDGTDVLDATGTLTRRAPEEA